MPYSKFPLRKAVEDFKLTLVEGEGFLPELPDITPTALLKDTFKETVSWAVAVGTEKARSEDIISPVLLEVKRQLKGEVSIFYGEEFNVQPEDDLTDPVDFLISGSPEQLYIKAPVVVLIEANNENLNAALGKCIAKMVAAQRFNQRQQQTLATIYGIVTSGTFWRFLKLEIRTVTIDLTDYPRSPVEQNLATLIWMCRMDDE